MANFAARRWQTHNAINWSATVSGGLNVPT
nr:MAG TPA: hypothetical protein [Caudoviricetes sp.]